MKASWIRSVVQGTILVLVCAASPGLLADGMVIPQRAYALPTIPDQQALIHFANGIETLAIETSFDGKGTNFAWVVPLPTPPRIEPASAGLFPTLQVIFQPAVILSVKPYWIVLPAALIVCWLTKLIRRESFFGCLVLGLMILPAALVLPPVLGTGRSRGGASGSLAANVRVLARQQAGLYETVTLQAKDPSALVEWLNQNDFAVPTNLWPAVAAYVRDGWVFAAARLRCEPDEKLSRATHPLVFSFRTSSPVYPLRLTGMGTVPCRIDLYVFGPRMATVSGFAVKRCETPEYESQADTPRLFAGPLRIRHQELRRLVANAPVATRLTAVLTPAEMQRDAYVDWIPYCPSGGSVFTTKAALTYSGNLAALSLMALLAVWWLLLRSSRFQRIRPARWGRWLVPISLGVGVVAYTAFLPVTSAHSLRWGRFSYRLPRHIALSLAVEIGDELLDLRTRFSPAASGRSLSSQDLDALRQSMFQARPQLQGSALTNLFTGEPIRFEASPGNLILRPVAGSEQSRSIRFELVWHDLDGAEAITNSVPLD